MTSIEALADEAATAVVAAMDDTPWWLSRLALVHWVRRVDPARAEPMYAALSQLRVDVMTGGAGARPALAAAWRSRLRHLLDGEPRLVDPLRALLAEGLAAGAPDRALAWVAEAEEAGVISMADRGRALNYHDRTMRSGGPFASVGVPLTIGQAGDYDAAVPATEAVTAYRRLAADDPTGYEPDLLRALISQCHALAWGGDEASADAAEAAGAEAVELHRRLGGDEPRLAAMLFDLSQAVAELSRNEQRAAYLTAAVDLYRPLAGHRPELAAALHERYLALSRLGRTEDAIAAGGEGVAVRRELAAADFAGHGKALASELGYLREALSEAGRYEEAVSVAEELIRLYENDRAANEGMLAATLDDRSADLERAGRAGEASPGRVDHGEVDPDGDQIRSTSP